MLQVRGIDSFYGASQALFKVSLEINRGEVVTLLGRNGMGKSTTIKTIMGLVRARSGSINYRGIQLDRLESFQIARRGLGLVPEGRQIFSNLTVYENLMVVSANYLKRENPYQIEDILTIFPRLSQRLKHFGNQLSGGEQQMLAIGRALMINPTLLILDEATEGLAPLIRQEIWRGLLILKEKGLAILIIDKNLEALYSLAQRHYIMEKGAIVWHGETADLQEDSGLRVRYLGV